MKPSISQRKILMILESCFPTEGGGGAENQVRTLSRYLDSCGVPVTIVVPMAPRGVQQEHDAVDGVPVWRIPYPPVRKLGGLIMIARYAWYLFRQRHNYDVVHAHIANNLAVVSCIAGRLLGKTVIVKPTGSMELAQGVLDKESRGIGVTLKRAALKCASYFQATSSEIEGRLCENGFSPDRIRVIPNAVDIDRFSRVPVRRSTGAHPQTAIYVGRLENDKGTDILVSAWIDAFPRNSGIRLMLIGEGEQRNMLEQMIEENGRDDIALLGPKDDVAPFLATADFAVLPSRYEGLSNALLEYMAAGLPVLGTRVSGTGDFIEPDRSGWLVDSENREQMVEKLRDIGEIETDFLQILGENARQRVTTRARIDAVTTQLAELYEINAALLKCDARSECV